MSSRPQPRDYYTHLFSPDSEDTPPALSSHIEDDFDLPNFGSNQIKQQSEKIEISNIERLLDNLYDQFGETSSSSSSSSGENSDDFDTHTSSRNFGTSQFSHKISDDEISASSSDSDSSMAFLSEEDMVRLLKDDSAEIVEQKTNQYRNPILHSQQSKVAAPEINEDRIGTFNVQNQYEHTLAAKLFVEGGFTFLSLQEPFASHDSIGDSWGAYRRLELNSARIACFETHHQIILFDNWRWGGKIIDIFANFLNGRVTSIAFGFENQQSLGIISVYGFARGSQCLEKGTQENDLRKSLLLAVKKISRKWKAKFPNIKIMIMGDMQETLSTSDIDNLGTCRYSNIHELSIIENFRDSHSSVVRDRLPKGEQYLTRFGLEGARGIDHILFPEGKDQNLIKEAHIDSSLGPTFFPSDHKLLYCTFLRNGANNIETGAASTQYAFKEVYQIKMKRTGPKGNILELDDSQFKHSKSYEKQATLFQKLQDLTADNASATGFHLRPIEQSINLLYNSLWKDGLEQNINGPENKLVSITERHAAELAAIVNNFDAGIKDSMTFLELSNEHDCMANMATTRSVLRKKSSFKLFQNLPLPTKLRYLRGWVKGKNRRIRRHIIAIKEIELRNRLDANQSDKTFCPLRNWETTIDSVNLTSSAAYIHSLLLAETEERDNHISAVRYKENTAASIMGKIRKKLDPFRTLKGNSFENVSEKTIKLLNAWLLESDCAQCFDTQSKQEPFHFLLEDFKSWNDSLAHINPQHIDWRNITHTSHTKLKLDEALDKLRKIESKIGRAQQSYKHSTIEYLLQVNKIEAFTRKVRPKAREAPATHTEIWDSKLEKFRLCRDEKEELLATGEHHGTWMGNSSAEENCAFASLKEEGLLGIRGVNLHPNRKVSYADIPKLIKNGHKLSLRNKKAFLAAHGNHTASLFQYPEEDHKSLRYPFFLSSSGGDMENESEVEELFWKAIASVPGKARYEGFQMAVVGRFGRRWQQALLNIVKLILVMRFIPKRLKSIARFPIPKPGRVNEYRPISLCHDTYCFINSISTKFSSQGIQEANILHEGIAAYVKGKGCSMLVGVEQGVREDCLESGVPTSQTDEDEEKFFDRIPVEILLAAMRTNGFPDQGYVELKASGMGAKTVEIITVKGTAYARFVCGLEQGNPDSPTIANLVIKFKHDIWRDVLQDVYKNNKDNTNNSKNKEDIRKNLDAYRFHITDLEDGEVTVDRIGYCDDNTRYTSSMNELEVIKATKLYIKRAGDLSLVTKIGRKGSKSEVHYYNLSAETAIKLEAIDSYAWSFSTDGPEWDKVPFKIQLQDSELKKAYKLSDFHNLDEEAQLKFLSIFKPQAHKHLGLKSNLAGNTDIASAEVLNKIKARLKSLNLANMNHNSQQLCANMLCSTVHSYAPLQMSHNTKDLLDCDKLLIEYVKKRKGLSSTDAKHSIFLDSSNGGYGFNSFLEVDLVANARELEIILNGHLIDSEVIRARASAFLIRHDRPDTTVFANFTGKAIHKLADYGFHIRDSRDGIINQILGHFNRMKSFTSIGADHAGSQGNTFSIGLGKEKLRNIAFGSKLHVFLKKAVSPTGEIKSNLIIPEDLSPKVSLPLLKRLVKKFKFTAFNELATQFNFWEWTNNIKQPVSNLPSDRGAWKYINTADIIKAKFPNSYWTMSKLEIRREAQKIIELQNMHGHIVTFLDDHNSPAFVATDGGHKCNEKSHLTTCAAVLCIPNLKSSESLQSDNWEHRKAIPLIARLARLPHSVGGHNTDIAHGEGMALCMGLEMFPKSFPKVIITDSASTRDIFLALRDRDHSGGQDRIYIRKMVSGISKHIGDRIEAQIAQGIDYDTDTANVFEKERENLSDWLDICNTWTCPNNQDTNENTKFKGWNPQYVDHHAITPILKVDSHQLNSTGDGIKAPPRYPNLTPNIFLLSCNHFADVGASIASSEEFTHESDILSIAQPSSKLRFFFTWNGVGIDRHISDFLYSKFQKEKLKHIMSKNTQGLPWRLIPNSCMSWNDLLRRGGLFRMLRGLSRCHTRSLYKSVAYRKGWIACLKESMSETDYAQCTNFTNQRWIRKLSTCKWCTNCDTERKGNRTHAILFCDHPRLSSFRNNAISLLEQKIYSFVQLVSSTQSREAANIFLSNVESTLSSLHGINIDEISQENAHSLYRNRASWIQEEGVCNWSDLEKGDIPIYSKLFGFLPIAEDGIPEDKFLNLAHGILFGIIPNLLEKEVSDMSENIKNFNMCQESCRNIRKVYQTSWNEIKEINLAKVIGLHRIINDISKNLEAEFREKFKIQDNTHRAIIKPLRNKPKATSNISILRGKDHPIQNIGNRKKRKVHFELTEFPKKLCSGITCNRGYTSWNHSTTIPHRISSSQKHCNRCSRQSTAIRKCITILKACNHSKRVRDNENVVSFFEQTEEKMNFKRAKHVIETVINTQPITTQETKSNQSRYALKKETIKDADKLVFKTLRKSIGNLTNRQDDAQKRISSASLILQDTSNNINAFLKDDSKRNSTLLQKIRKKKTYNQKNIQKRIIVNNKEITVQEKVWCSNNFQNQMDTSRLQIGSYNQLVGGDAINLVIMNLRFAATEGVFIGNAATTSVLNNCTTNKDWLQFAVCFGSKKALYKPHGTYIIPIFQGDNTGGHWLFMVVDKRKSFCRGWIMDSLGRGSSTSESAKKIKSMFSNSRMKCSWIATDTVRQTELECGPRTICGMVSICESLKRKISIEEAIRSATRVGIAEGTYDSMTCRRRALGHIQVSKDTKIAYEAATSEMRRERKKLSSRKAARPRENGTNQTVDLT